ncbi:MAG: 16S rRNA (cytosine(1402)-N(4))-methyltransferase RsmH, partial [Thermoguttaceae bacterium]
VGNIRFAHANYADLPDALEMLGYKPTKPPVLDGILLDIGLSSDQLADRERGFSFEADGPLDLRFDTSEGRPAHEFLTFWSEEQIANIIYEYGEEKFSRRIAKEIVNRRREQKPIRFAQELAELVRKIVPKERRSGRDSRGNKSVSIDPATRTFQALRIAVNDELGSLKTMLSQASRFLKPGGRIAVISFHSLEDRIVKNAFRDDANLEILTKKPVLATDEEILQNPRSRSAKLRVAAKIIS